VGTVTEHLPCLSESVFVEVVQIRELLYPVRQADKVNGHMRASRVAGNGERNPNLALALRVKTRCSHGAGCSGKEFPSCEHKTSRFIIPGPRVSAIFR
jgi:hypothetical protein